MQVTAHPIIRFELDMSSMSYLVPPFNKLQDEDTFDSIITNVEIDAIVHFILL